MKENDIPGAVVTKKVMVTQLQELMKKKNMTKMALAEQMGTSRSAVDRLLDPHNVSVTLLTIEKAAVAMQTS